ncbi:MAG: rhodanese-like domain-containing protein, partial [Pseudomonadota bacterium]
MDYVHPEYLIEPAALAAKLEEPGLRVFDATVHLVPAERGYRAESGKADYDEGHIRGAVFLDQLRALSDTTSGLGFTLPEASVLQAALGAAGITADSDVVVYSSGHMMWATRAWWLLHYAGVEKAAVLNGGFRSWKDAGLPVSRDAATYPAGSFQGAVRSNRFVDQRAVLDAIGSDAICTVNALA